ncbi:MAG: YetF domain-containing protein, partial [Dehalococcoidia bacterium]
MSGSEIEVLDLKRMFVGDISLWFAVEVALRTCIIYTYTLLLVRLLGKRGMGQLAPFELVIIIGLGSAVGDPMFYADVPLVHAMVVVTAIVFLNKGLAWFTGNSDAAHEFVDSRPRRLVTDGVVDLGAIQDEHLAHEDVFMELRLAGVEQLGEVRRAYLEPSGGVSVFRAAPQEARPGLRLIPRHDPDAPAPLPPGSAAPDPGAYACAMCGLVTRVAMGEPFTVCPSCRRTVGWLPA